MYQTLACQNPLPAAFTRPRFWVVTCFTTEVRGVFGHQTHPTRVVEYADCSNFCGRPCFYTMSILSTEDCQVPRIDLLKSLYLKFSESSRLHACSLFTEMVAACSLESQTVLIILDFHRGLNHSFLQETRSFGSFEKVGKSKASISGFRDLSSMLTHLPVPSSPIHEGQTLRTPATVSWEQTNKTPLGKPSEYFHPMKSQHPILPRGWLMHQQVYVKLLTNLDRKVCTKGLRNCGCI